MKTSKTLVLNLTREWFEKIRSGEKTVEYREMNMYWWKRLVTPIVRDGGGVSNSTIKFKYKHVEFRLGYSKKGAITRRILGVDFGPCPYPGWDGTYFRIYFRGPCERELKKKGGRA